MAEEIVTGILVKTSKETPLQGKVINTVDTPYPEENAYSVDMIKKMLVPPFNLLVNPDFQCNQRGQSEYNFDTTGKYGIDMWMHRQGNYSGALIVSPLKGGGCHIELSAGSMGGLRQYLDKDIDDLKIGQKYTAVISIDNVRYKGTITLQSSNNDIKIIDNDLLSITFYHNSNDKRVYYSLWFKNAGFECDINYADLFEGETDYPHIKEDYSIALLRCQRYLKVLRHKFVLGTVNVINNTTAYCSINHSLINIPTIKFGNGIIVTQRAGNTTITSIIIDQGITDKYNLFLYLRTNEGNSFAQDDSGFCYCNATDGYLELTCEPQ